MYTVTINSEESTNKFAAYMNAKTRSAAASTHYDYAQKLQAERIKFVLEIVYAAKDIYVTFRKKFIAIKIDNARVRDKAKLAEFEMDWAAQGIVKVVTPQGVTYRLPKA